MIDRVLDFLAGRDAPSLSTSGLKADDLELSVAALLVEAARMDDHFDAAERTTIERVLSEKFKLTPTETRSLIEQAEVKVDNSSQIFPFTHVISERMSPEGRVEMIEMLWKVVYADDGVLDPYEDMLIRRIAGLIHVPDRDRGMARHRALEQLAAAKAAANSSH